MMYLHLLNSFDGLNSFHHNLDIALSSLTLFAQQTDINLIGDLQRTWNNLLRTGQLAAFFIGLIVGWGLKSLLP